jgi:hypothetical protein
LALTPSRACVLRLCATRRPPEASPRRAFARKLRGFDSRRLHWYERPGDASAPHPPPPAGRPVAWRAVSFVPGDFEPPRELVLPQLHLVPLGAEHNKSDHAAWTSSIAHVRATPGFESTGWPPVEGMSLDANRADLEAHARDFAERSGFTFTVLRPGTEEVIGCLYIYPATDGEHDAQVRSWVRADVAELDAPLHAAVLGWLSERWPFERVSYADRAA